MNNNNDNKTIIKDNRIISDYTYAVRNLSLLCDIYPDYPTSGPMEEEEFEYLCITACELIKHQVNTCPAEEKWYFNNLVPNYKNYKEIILNHVCKLRPEFGTYLKNIKAV